MFIKLTNAASAHKGKQLAINADTIVTMHADKVEIQHEDSTYLEDVTYLFCPPHGTWEVSESIDEIMELVNESIMEFINE